MLLTKQGKSGEAKTEIEPTVTNEEEAPKEVENENAASEDKNLNTAQQTMTTPFIYNRILIFP